MANIISEETKKLIVELYKSNKYSKHDIAVQCNCSRSTVTRILEKQGILSIHLSPKLEAVENDVVKDFVENHMYCKDIAIKYQIGETSVYRILNKNNIKRQSGCHSNCIEDFFEKIDTPDKAYMLGFITADGAVVNDVLSIEVSNDDIEILKFFQSRINPQATIFPIKNKDTSRISLSAKQLGRDLAKYGVIQNKSKIIKRVPTELISEELLHFYFRGLIDGDGCIHTDGKVSIYSGSYDFIADVQRILIEKVGVSHLKIYQGTSYFITWGSKIDEVKLFNYLYKDLDATYYYKRKYERLKNKVTKAP